MMVAPATVVAQQLMVATQPKAPYEPKALCQPWGLCATLPMVTLDSSGALHWRLSARSLLQAVYGYPLDTKRYSSGLGIQRNKEVRESS